MKHRVLMLTTGAGKNALIINEKTARQKLDISLLAGCFLWQSHYIPSKPDQL